MIFMTSMTPTDGLRGSIMKDGVKKTLIQRRDQPACVRQSRWVGLQAGARSHRHINDGNDGLCLVVPEDHLGDQKSEEEQDEAGYRLWEGDAGSLEDDAHPEACGQHRRDAEGDVEP